MYLASLAFFNLINNECEKYWKVCCVENSAQSKFEEESEEVTLDGSVDLHGGPAIRAKSGRWVAAIIILCKLNPKTLTARSFDPIFLLLLDLGEG